MSDFDYRWVEGDVEPAEVDLISSPKVVYIHKNIRKEQRIDPDTSEVKIFWVYEEAVVSKQKYDDYLQEKTQADIAYLYLMGGYDYE